MMHADDSLHDPRIGLFYGILQKEVCVDILILTLSCKLSKTMGP